MEAREGSVDGIIFDKMIIKMGIIAKKKKFKFKISSSVPRKGSYF